MIIGTIISLVAGKLLSAYEAFQRKEITKAELDARVKEATLQATVDTEKAVQETVASVTASIYSAISQSKIMQWVWAGVVGSQTLVLLWHQIGIPAYVNFTGDSWPSSGATVEWAYLLVAAALGLGPLVFRKK